MRVRHGLIMLTARRSVRGGSGTVMDVLCSLSSGCVSFACFLDKAYKKHNSTHDYKHAKTTLGVQIN